MSKHDLTEVEKKINQLYIVMNFYSERRLPVDALVVKTLVDTINSLYEYLNIESD